MKKLLLILMLCLAFVARPSTQVSWSMPGSSDEVRKVNNDPLDAGSIWQLIWSPDQVISDFNPTNPFLPDASESLLSEFASPNGSYIFPAENFNSPTDEYVGGYVYTRVFDYTGVTSGFNLIDLDGMMYAESSFSGPLQKLEGSPPGSPTIHNPFTIGGPTIVDQTFVIPEPTTIAILVMAVLGLVGFRKHLRKN